MADRHIELRHHCQAVKNINDHILDKQAERDELIETVRKMCNLSQEEFEDAYRKVCPGLKTEQAKAFYIQHPRLTRESDGLMHFWRRTDCGYGPPIAEAKLFTLDEVMAKHSVQSGEKLAWAKEYIDERVVDGKVKADRCEIEVAVALAGNN